MRHAIFFLTITTLAIAGQFVISLGDQYPYTISAITTDSSGNTYVVGSRQLSTTSTDVFLSKIDSNGKLLFTDTFGGDGSSFGSAITLDPSGNIYIAGYTASDDFPLSKALQTQPAIYNNQTGFIMKLSNDGTTILYSTFFGGTQGPSNVTALTTDRNGNLYVTGSTSASDFPITPGLPAGPASDNSIYGAIVAEISSAGDKIIYSGVISGTNNLGCFCTVASAGGATIALDAADNVYIGGNTNTTNIPTTGNAFAQKGYGPFVAKVNAGGLGYLTYIDSTLTPGVAYVQAYTAVLGIAVDASGNVYLSGEAGDPNFPTTAGTLQPTYAGGPISGSFSGSEDAFVVKLNPSGSALIWSTFLAGASSEAFGVALDAAGNVWISGNTSSTTLPNANSWTSGGDFVAALNPTGTQLQYSARYPTGTARQSLAFDSSGLLHFAGPNGFVSAINPSALPPMEIFTLQNVFGGAATARVAAGEVISIFGPGIGPMNEITASPVKGFYPTTLGGVTVSIEGFLMPLLYASANQINAIMPAELYNSSFITTAAIDLTNGTGAIPSFPVVIVPSAPQAFPTVLNQDGTVNSQSNPAKAASIITFYATGWGSPSNPDGEVVTTADNNCIVGCSANSSIPGIPVTVLYEGPAPGIVAGVTQFNVQIGTFSSPTSASEVTISIGSPAVRQSVWVLP